MGFLMAMHPRIHNAQSLLFTVESDTGYWREELSSVVKSGAVFFYISFVHNNQVFKNIRKTQIH